MTTPERSEKQRQQSRINGARSKGPRNTDVTRFNGLKHGLCAEAHVLPGEDPAAFRAEVDAWFGEWAPISHTRAVLVGRAALASWRLTRCVLAESAHRARLAEDAGRAFDHEVAGRVDRAVARFESEPMAALSLLESHAAGIDRVLASWAGLVEAVAAGPAGWNRPLYHQRLLVLMGHHTDAVAIEAGAVHVASSRLLHSHVPGPAGKVLPLSEADAAAAFEAVRGTVESEVARLHERRGQVPDLSGERRRAMAAAACDTSKEAQLMHRYEMAHERSLRSAIRQLLELDRSGADLAGPEPEPEPEPAPAEPPTPQPVPPQRDTHHGDPAPPASGPAASGSVGADDLGSTPSPDAAPIGGPKPPPRRPEGGAGGRKAP